MMKSYVMINNSLFDQIKKDFNEMPFDELFLVQEFEFDFFRPKKLIKFANKYKIKIIYLTGGSPSEWYQQTIKNNKLKNCKILYLTHFGLIHILLNDDTVDYINYSNQKHKLSYNFCCYNNMPHLHRCLFIDKLAKNNLLKNNIVTWNHKIDYPFKYFNNLEIKLNDNFSKPNGFVMSSEFFESFCFVITETTVDVINFTEKTSKPIVYKKPFLILGAPGIHKFLKDQYDIQPYDEIFDYSFDSEVNLSKRCDMIIENLKQIENMDLIKTTALLQNKLNHNREQIIKLAKDFKKTISNEILHYINSDPIVTSKFDDLDKQFKYVLSQLKD